ncbi:phosphonate ABC transporter ATP-binding protein [Ignavigranum ruoffiae]|uniref:Phosphonate transport system ATP-binding protein n=1 Tax=Ignavigranum ruoffiae TaxID=89093 RepID=A0A1H9B013_9LACT|nr:phosphonate ABC transporter ATP-binding protein [Ignavigranum ruoffiae]SEP82370.1 phosphonate transport system ATP-binding protein [Ignavigranum ruoffiae]
MIELRNVSKVYANGVRGLDQINLTINQGEFVAVIGSSGAGKSTLLRTINRLIEVSDGEVFINGQSLTQARGRELREIRRNIGMIFQQFQLIKRHTVQKNVISGRLGYYNNLQTLLGWYRSTDYQKVIEALKLVGLEDKLKERSRNLSGGQQQRVSIARAIVQEAEIILADEPVASLDPVIAESVMKDFQRLNQKYGRTIVINLHSIDLARRYASRIIGMQSGRIVFDGPVQEADDARLEEIYGESLWLREVVSK